MNLTIEAFPCGIDNGEVITGAPSNDQVEWSPLLNLKTKNKTI